MSRTIFLHDHLFKTARASLEQTPKRDFQVQCLASMTPNAAEANTDTLLIISGAISPATIAPAQAAA